MYIRLQSMVQLTFGWIILSVWRIFLCTPEKCPSELQVFVFRIGRYSHVQIRFDSHILSEFLASNQNISVMQEEMR